jgi:oxygen-independent coproporphyrinogen-3 oxidase
MIAAMLNELRLSAKSFSHQIETIYFGGGTPSLLSTEEINNLLDEVRSIFTHDENAEITLEANPDDITAEKLVSWKVAGINRFSVGIQSFKKDDLIWMNRAHNSEQAQHCITLIKDAGFNNFSADLIYGTPTLCDEDWKSNVDKMIALDVPHLSCYALTVENKTALQKMIALKKVSDVDSEKQARQFLQLMDCLAAAGYEHYEISNFAKPGFKSKHNSSYWQRKPYLGIGPSAHSFNGKDIRRWNVNNNAAYISSLQKNIIPFQQEKLSATQQLNEYIMISLRTQQGIDLNFVTENFGKEKTEKLQWGSKKYIDNKKLQAINDNLILTREGELFADGIAADFFFDD